MTRGAQGLVRKAVLDDVPAIHRIIEAFASKGIMLHRPASEIYDNLRDFFIAEREGQLVGVCALSITGDLGEIRSLAVKENCTGKGIGRALVTACLDEARTLGLRKVFALTYKTGFFQKIGFRVINKEVLPHKIWGDCIRCVKFPNCDENAVIVELGQESGQKAAGTAR